MVSALLATLVLLGVETIAGMVVVLLLVAVSIAAAGVALGPERALLTEPPAAQSVEPANNGVLLMNACSGGGKGERFRLVEEAAICMATTSNSTTSTATSLFAVLPVARVGSAPRHAVRCGYRR